MSRITSRAERFTGGNYDRRGRGGSGGAPPYAIQREGEDIAALLAEAGEAAHLYGPCAGGGPVLRAAAAALPADRLAVYDVPYCVAGDGARQSPMWPGLLAIEHAIAYAAACSHR